MPSNNMALDIHVAYVVMTRPETAPEMIARNYRLPTGASLSELGSLVFFLPMFPMPGGRIYIARAAMQ
jgi:hypothetical protein